MSFQRAASWAWHFGVGIGYVLSEDDPFTCIDLDVKDANNEIDPGKWTTWEELNRFARILSDFDTYAELSQSGQGVHLWMCGKVGRGCRRNHVEVYSQQRFIACTGNVFFDRPIRERQALLNMLVLQMRGPTTEVVALNELPPLESDDEHWHRKARASNGWKFLELWNGRWEALCIGDGTQSCADMALIRMLCFNNPSNGQVRRMFRDSALGLREKARRVDYVDGMIATARAADAERERMRLQVSAAMDPYIDAGIAAYYAKWGRR